jgi:chorismate synthase
MALRLTTAGESHGPALAAIVTGLPAGLRLEKAAIDDDLRRRQMGYGRSPRQKLEADEVEVLSGLRHGVTLGTPLTLVVRNRDHANWSWGMSPWPPPDEPAPHGKGTKRVTLPRPGHADLPGVLKYGHDDVRNALERASARHTAVHVAAGAVAKALLRELGVEVAGRPVEIGGETTEDGMRDATDAARKDRDTLGGVVEVVATGVPPGLGSYAEKADRLDARLAFALMGIQAVKGVEVGEGFALARRRGTEAHDEIDPGLARRTNRAGGIEAGVSNGEPIVVRAAMKPLPTLMRPLDSVDLDTGEPAQALVERSDVQAVEALAVVAEAAVAFELARAALDKLGGDALVDVLAARDAYVARISDRWHAGDS